MSRIRGKNTFPEKVVCRELRRAGLRFRRNVVAYPGTPDIVFANEKLVVFIDGDFWHGWRFPLWEHKMSEPWRKKIATTRARDSRNFRLLRRMGWTVLRVWEHEVESDLSKCVARILTLLRSSTAQDAT